MVPDDFAAVEARWKERWAHEALDRTPTPAAGEKFYCLDFFPYPSGDGLSMGHGRNYVPSDVVARYHRRRGQAVLHPMGWDAFGLPAENEAIACGTHPAESTVRYAANYHRQLQLLGCSYDWEREIASSSPDYYRWTQWFFLLFHRGGLAYRAEAPVNWCEQCQTGLADEEIEEGACWRCHRPVGRRWQKQWFLRITAYAEELLSALDHLDWPEHIVAMQRAWIGRSEGAEINLSIASTAGPEGALTVFTTRPDTFFGVTFVALAPEHPLALQLARPERRDEVEAYVAQARRRSDAERFGREPDGVSTGAEAILPPDGRHVPVFVADYVLAGHGSGIVMGVPAHDVRDHAFARRHGLPVQVVVAPPGWDGTPLAGAYTGEGTMVASGRFDSMPSDQARAEVTRWLQTEGFGRPAATFRLRDWLVSRQRYWGAPIPIVHCRQCGEVPVPESDLPVQLPPLPDYHPRGDGRSPLANLPDFVHTVCPACGRPAERETDTLTGFTCSSWYYLRFVSPHDPHQPFDPREAERWLPVDLYIGGAEHAIGHLLYARFWTKVLADAGMISFREPFPTLRSQGIMHARDPQTGRVQRMSKSRRNIVTPDSVVGRYGADVTRLYLLTIAPFEANAVWEVEEDGRSPRGIAGTQRFLQAVWRLAGPPAGTAVPAGPTAEEVTSLRRAMHQTIQQVGAGVESFRFTKAINALSGFAGTLERHREQYGDTPAFREGRRSLVSLLAPFAPFLAEEAWARLDEPFSVHQQPWPAADPALARPEVVEVVVQVDGRVRDWITVAVDAEEEEVRRAALAAPRAQRWLAGRPVQRVIVVPGRVVNLVTR